MILLFYFNYIFSFLTTLNSFFHHSIPRRSFSVTTHPINPISGYLKQSFTIALSFRNEIPLKEGTGKSYPKLDFNEDYYSVLEVSPTIPASDLKKAYYKMVFKYHPDNKVGEELKSLCNKQVRNKRTL